MVSKNFILRNFDILYTTTMHTLKKLLFVGFIFLFIWLSYENISQYKNHSLNTTTPVPSLGTTTATKIAKQTKPAVATSTKVTTPVARKKLISKSAPTSATQTNQSTPITSVDFEAINTFARPSVVNILCTAEGSIGSIITATGVVIDPRGIILTNAHVGQYFLLRDYPTKDNVTCVVRTGSPAYPRYHAELMFISPLWVQNNKTLLKETEPKGTGEYDFALIHITDAIDGSTLPQNFSFIAPDTSETISENDPVVLVSYPAGFLGGMTIEQNLFVTSAVTTVKQLFTFTEKSIDIVSVPGTVVSQRGASGGAVVNTNNKLISIITTSSDATTTSARDLYAITLGYINRDLKAETGGNLADLLAQNPSTFSQTFHNTIAGTLTKLITDALSK
ncbi:MAG: serine protease [bacterium]